MSFFESQDLDQMGQLSRLIIELNKKGHCPATSGNFSLKSIKNSEQIIISESGVDKETFNVENLIPIDMNGDIHSDFIKPGRKSSDETDLHLMVYRNTNAGCVLHSHHLNNILFADLFPGTNIAWIENLELLKGFSGTKTHKVRIPIPIFENSQDINELSKEVESELNKHNNCFGFLLRGHGITCWGKDLAEAKRHLEVFEYIFSYYLKRRV